MTDEIAELQEALDSGNAKIEVTEWDHSRAFDDLTPGVRRAVFMVHSGRVEQLTADERFVIMRLYEAAKPFLYASKCIKTGVVKYLDPPPPPEPVIAQVSPELMAALTKPQTINIEPKINIEMVTPERQPRKTRTKVKLDERGRIEETLTEDVA
jgi:hypothetical protein